MPLWHGNTRHWNQTIPGTARRMPTATFAADVFAAEKRTGSRIRRTSRELRLRAARSVTMAVHSATTLVVAATSVARSTIGGAAHANKSGGAGAIEWTGQMVSRELSKAGAEIRRALDAGQDSVLSISIRLPRPTVERLLRLVEAENSGGALVIRGTDEFSPAEAAVLLGISRPTLMNRVADGSLEARKTRGRWVVTATSVLAYQNQLDLDRAATDRALAELAAGVGLPPRPRSSPGAE